MVYPETGTVTVVRVPKSPAVPSAMWTAPEKADFDARLTAAAAPKPLAEHSDTDTTGLADGHTWLWNAATSTWGVGDPSGAIPTIKEDGATDGTDIDSIDFRDGLDVVVTGTEAAVSIEYGGTGTSKQVARRDHTHNPAIITGPQTFAATGALSSGTRSLLTLNVALNAGVTYDCWARVVVTVRNDVNAGVAKLGLRIGGSASFPKTTTDVRNVGGVDSQHEWTFVRSAYNGGQIVGTGATVAIEADITYDSGDPTNVRHGWVEFFAFPRS